MLWVYNLTLDRNYYSRNVALIFYNYKLIIILWIVHLTISAPSDAIGERTEVLHG